ncbi:MAG: hypothetical protein KAW41_05995 [Candidatus Diapherotrites archaeon]|nr:hypothetical protein [Candidatus Diapherotrites archaeon]
MPKGLERAKTFVRSKFFRPKKEKKPEKPLEERKKSITGHHEKILDGMKAIAKKAGVGPAAREKVWGEKWAELIEKKGEYTPGLTTEESMKEINAKVAEDSKEVERTVRAAEAEMNAEIQKVSKVILTSAPEYFKESGAYLQQVMAEVKAGGDRGEYEAAVKHLMKINTELLLQMGDTSASMWGYRKKISSEGTEFVKRNMDKMEDQLREQDAALKSALEQKPNVFTRFKKAAAAKNPFRAMVKKPTPKGKPTKA